MITAPVGLSWPSMTLVMRRVQIAFDSCLMSSTDRSVGTLVITPFSHVLLTLRSRCDTLQGSGTTTSFPCFYCIQKAAGAFDSHFCIRFGCSPSIDRFSCTNQGLNSRLKLSGIVQPQCFWEVKTRPFNVHRSSSFVTDSLFTVFAMRHVHVQGNAFAVLRRTDTPAEFSAFQLEPIVVANNEFHFTLTVLFDICLSRAAAVCLWLALWLLGAISVSTVFWPWQEATTRLCY